MLQQTVGLEGVKEEVARGLHDAMGRQTLQEKFHFRHVLMEGFDDKLNEARSVVVEGAFGSGKKTSAQLMALLSVVIDQIPPAKAPTDNRADKMCSTCGKRTKHNKFQEHTDATGHNTSFVCQPITDISPLTPTTFDILKDPLGPGIQYFI